MPPVKRLTADVLEGFAQLVLSKNFDDYKETPSCHREWWETCVSDHPLVAICAPRGHAKSTTITHCYTLAACLFKERKYVIVVSDTYEQAVLFLQDMKKELIANEDLIALFGVERIEKDAENDLIVRLKDGYRFRITAKGAEQKMRGLKWDGMRPDLIICHEEGTLINTPETGWIKNTDHPNARRIKAHEAYEITFEGGTKEVVSSDHRYMVDGKWKYAWELKTNDNVDENISDATLNAILSEERHLLQNTQPSKKPKPASKSGLNRMESDIKLQKLATMFVTKSAYVVKLRNMLKTMRAGKRQRALCAELEKCKQHLSGLIQRLSNEYMKMQNTAPLVMDASGT